MESRLCVSGFLLLLFSTEVQLSKHPAICFGHEGGNAEIRFKYDPDLTLGPRSILYNLVFYRIFGHEDLLLVNCSQPRKPQPDGYNVKCKYSNFYGHYFEMSSLTMSHSGDYRAEGRRWGNITEHRRFHLTVCAEHARSVPSSARFGDSVELCTVDSSLGQENSLLDSLGQGRSLQLYRGSNIKLDLVLVLDTNSSLEPLVEDLRGRLQVNLNTSLLTLSGLSNRDYNFLCVAWQGAQCQSYRESWRRISGKLILAHEEENVTLPCIAKGELPDQVYWTTDTGHGRLVINQTHPQEVMNNHTHPQEVMYMLNGSQTGDYSLIIPSVTLQHSGKYECKGSYSENDLLVCTKLHSLEVKFSPGQNVYLNITGEKNNFGSFQFGTQWYRQIALKPQVLIIDYDFYTPRAPVSLPEDLRGRVTLSTISHSFLIISNLTAEDSGLYTWRLYGWSKCSQGSFRLVYLDPFGVHSPFYRVYAPLIGCGLLGLVAAVIWFKLRSRRGEQTSGRQSREGQQSGDEDLYDDVEMAP